MFKKTITVLLSLVLLAQPVTSQASLTDAFASLTNGAAVAVNKPGRYQSGARNSFSGGGLEIRAPRQSSTPQLFSFTPPAVSAGCGGISATFGGFSFISGAEFEQMLKQLASGAALGFVSMLAIKSLCPACEAVIQFLKSAAQQAARLSKDACRFGQQMGADMLKGMGIGNGDSTRNYCTATNMARNKSGDAMSLADTIGGYCYQMKDAIDNLLDKVDKTDPSKVAALACDVGGMGNVTWGRLLAFDSGKDADAHKRRLLWMNMMGAELAYIGESTDASGKKVPQAMCETEESGVLTPNADDGRTKTTHCVARLSPEDAMSLFMCGAPTADAVPAGLTATDVTRSIYGSVIDYCHRFFGKMPTAAPVAGAAEPADGVSTTVAKFNEIKVYYCGDTPATGGGNPTCNTLKLGPVSHVTSGTGYMVSVMKALEAGVNAVRTNTPMPEETIKLIQVAPFPLYQAINAAAVYPSATVDLLGGMGAMIAEQIAVGHLEEMMRMTGRTSGDSKTSCLSELQATSLMEAMARSRAVMKGITKQLGQNLAAQEQITQQIRQINLAIQRQVMSSEMLTSNIYSQGVTGKLRAVLPAASTTPTPTTP